MHLAVLGCGYVGLVTGACLADLGHTVVGVDNDPAKIKLLQQGLSPIYEPGLEPLVQANMKEGRLSFTSDVAQAVSRSEVVFICVPTPPLPDGNADLSYVESVMVDLAKAINRYTLIVEKSTVPVQTAQWLKQLAKEHLPADVEVDLASNPEFLSEGTAVRDFFRPDRIVIGAETPKAAGLLVELYAPLNAPLLITDIESAELIKHASNAFLATKISFINAVAQVCERTGADIEKVAKGIGLDKRIGESFLKAGIGYGGICFPKDVAAFIQIAAQKGYDFSLLKAVEDINHGQRRHVLEQVVELAGTAPKTVAVLGLTFKPNTDDLRDAPALTLIKGLLEAGYHVQAHDPIAMDKAHPLLAEVTLCASPMETVAGAHCTVVVTEWEAYKTLDMVSVKQAMAQPHLVDARNLYDPNRMKNLGFRYVGVGRS